MHVLVTGGAGFIGSFVVDRLLAAGHGVRVLDALDPQVHPDGPPPYLARDAQLVVADVRDRAAVERALDGIDAVVHAAATSHCTRWSTTSTSTCGARPRCSTASSTRPIVRESFSSSPR